MRLNDFIRCDESLAVCANTIGNGETRRRALESFDVNDDVFEIQVQTVEIASADSAESDRAIRFGRGN